MSEKYILVDGIVTPCDDVEVWAHFMEDRTARRIGLDNLVVNAVEIRVSTVFLGLDHRFGMSPEPILFETMIFGGKYDQYQWRYATRDEALAGHERAIAIAKGEIECE